MDTLDDLQYLTARALHALTGSPEWDDKSAEVVEERFGHAAAASPVALMEHLPEDWTSQVLAQATERKHAGPGPHPGTGSPQAVHSVSMGPAMRRLTKILSDPDLRFVRRMAHTPVPIQDEDATERVKEIVAEKGISWQGISRAETDAYREVFTANAMARVDRVEVPQFDYARGEYSKTLRDPVVMVWPDPEGKRYARLPGQGRDHWTMRAIWDDEAGEVVAWQVPRYTYDREMLINPVEVEETKHRMSTTEAYRALHVVERTSDVTQDVQGLHAARDLLPEDHVAHEAIGRVLSAVSQFDQGDVDPQKAARFLQLLDTAGTAARQFRDMPPERRFRSDGEVSDDTLDELLGITDGYNAQSLLSRIRIAGDGMRNAGWGDEGDEPSPDGETILAFPSSYSSDLKADVARQVADSWRDRFGDDWEMIAQAMERVGMRHMGTDMEGTASSTVQSWASTSNDQHAVSLAMQDAVEREFALNNVADWDHASPALAMDDEEILDVTVRDMYARTQRMFEDAGVTEVVLHRGQTAPPDWDGKMRPASSWSVDRAEAMSFARDTYGDAEIHFVDLDEGELLPSDLTNEEHLSLVLSATVPVNRILCTPKTGFGCLSEHEMVVLGGPLEWLTKPLHGETKHAGPGPHPGTGSPQAVHNLPSAADVAEALQHALDVQRRGLSDPGLYAETTVAVGDYWEKVAARGTPVYSLAAGMGKAVTLVPDVDATEKRWAAMPPEEERTGLDDLPWQMKFFTGVEPDGTLHGRSKVLWTDENPGLLPGGDDHGLTHAEMVDRHFMAGDLVTQLRAEVPFRRWRETADDPEASTDERAAALLGMYMSVQLIRRHQKGQTFEPDRVEDTLRAIEKLDDPDVEMREKFYWFRLGTMDNPMRIDELGALASDGKVDLLDTLVHTIAKDSWDVDLRAEDRDVVPVLGHAPSIQTRDMRQAAKAEITEKIAERSAMDPYDVSEEYLSTWAKTSNDQHIDSLLLQDTAARVFGLDDADDWPMEPRSMAPVLTEDERADLLNATYEHTQEVLREQGITHIRVHRGQVGWTGNLRPMSSWSTDKTVAKGFAKKQGVSSAREVDARDSSLREAMPDSVVVVSMDVPVEHVLCTSRTGLGCLSEAEVVLLSSAMDTLEAKHGGPGPHDSGTPQAIHGSWAERLGRLLDLPEDLIDVDVPGDGDVLEEGRKRKDLEGVGPFIEDLISDILPDPEYQTFDARDLQDALDDSDHPAHEQAVEVLYGLSIAEDGEIEDLGETWNAFDKFVDDVIDLDMTILTPDEIADLDEEEREEYDAEIEMLTASIEGGRDDVIYSLPEHIDYEVQAAARNKYDVDSVQRWMGSNNGQIEKAEYDIYHGSAEDVLRSDAVARALKHETASRLSKHLTEAQADALNEAYGTAPAMRATHGPKYAAASQVVSAWAQSSNDEHAPSLLMQDNAAEHFGLHRYSGWNHTPGTANGSERIEQRGVEDVTVAQRTLLQAMYTETQEHFKARGVTHVRLHRGQQDWDGTDRPLSSWSVDDDVARNFSGWSASGVTAIDHDAGPVSSVPDGPVLRTKTVPVSQILCYPGMGFGCLNESEFVVLANRPFSGPAFDPEDQLRLFPDEVKHLPGQHPQSTHGNWARRAVEKVVTLGEIDDRLVRRRIEASPAEEIPVDFTRGNAAYERMKEISDPVSLEEARKRAEQAWTKAVEGRITRKERDEMDFAQRFGMIPVELPSLEGEERTPLPDGRTTYAVTLDPDDDLTRMLKASGMPTMADRAMEGMDPDDRALAEAMLHGWARHPSQHGGRLLMRAAREEFGLERAALTPRPEGGGDPDEKRVARDLVRRLKAETEATFEPGEGLVLWRAVQGGLQPEEGKPYQTRPIESWSTEPDSAEFFAMMPDGEGTDVTMGADASVIKATVPADRILLVGVPGAELQETLVIGEEITPDRVFKAEDFDGFGLTDWEAKHADHDQSSHGSWARDAYAALPKNYTSVSVSNPLLNHEQVDEIAAVFWASDEEVITRVEWVDPRFVFSNQETVSEPRVDHLRQNYDAEDNPRLPLLTAVGERAIVDNGNHRVAAALQEGVPLIHARVKRRAGDAPYLGEVREDESRGFKPGQQPGRWVPTGEAKHATHDQSTHGNWARRVAENIYEWFAMDVGAEDLKVQTMRVLASDLRRRGVTEEDAEHALYAVEGAYFGDLPEYSEDPMERFTAWVVAAWAGSSAQSGTSIAMQDAAHRVFGVPVSDLPGGGKSSLDERAEGVYDALAMAQYDRVQQTLREMDTDEVILYRGMTEAPRNGTLRPLSSWSLEEMTAHSFADDVADDYTTVDRHTTTYPSREDYEEEQAAWVEWVEAEPVWDEWDDADGPEYAAAYDWWENDRPFAEEPNPHVVYEQPMPLSRIFSTPHAGFGSFTEQEVVVLSAEPTRNGWNDRAQQDPLTPEAAEWKHMGPGPHPSGSPQLVHAAGGVGYEAAVQHLSDLLVSDNDRTRTVAGRLFEKFTGGIPETDVAHGTLDLEWMGQFAPVKAGPDADTTLGRARHYLRGLPTYEESDEAHEQAIVVLRDGSIDGNHVKIGSARSIPFKGSDYRGKDLAAIVHNHPRDNPLSYGDVLSAVTLQADREEAVTRTGHYALSFDWGAVKSPAALRGDVQNVRTLLRGTGRSWVDDGTLTEDQFRYGAGDALARALAEHLPYVTYERTGAWDTAEEWPQDLVDHIKGWIQSS